MAICWGATCKIPLVTSACRYEVQVPSDIYDYMILSVLYTNVMYDITRKKRELSQLC